MTDTNRILFCSGMFSFAKTNEFTEKVADQIRKAFVSFQENPELNKENTTVVNQISAAEEIRKFKELADAGIITQEEFESKKKQLLSL